MKWYKRDPDAAIAGMIGLTLEERGAYNMVLDLLYSRDGNVPDDDRFMSRALECRPQVWRRVKAALIAKGKVRETDGKLTANRVEKELKTAHKLIENMTNLGAVSAEKRKENNTDAPTGPLGTSTSTSTSTSREKTSSSLARRAKPRTRLPEEWRPDDLAPEEQFQFDKFCDHARANGRLCAGIPGWNAAWRNWKRKGTELAQARTNGRMPRPGSWEDRQEKTANALAELDQYLARNADGARPSGGSRQADDGVLPLDKPA